MPKLGAAQFSGSTDVEANIAAIQRLSRKAAQAGVNLLCFHELANTVYLPFVEDQRLFELAEPLDGHSLQAARQAAIENELVLVYPFFEASGGSYYNSAVVFDPHGERLLHFRKSSVPSSRLLPAACERYYFSSGDLGFPVAETPFGVKVGLIICYDRNLPEPARCIALNGGEVLFVPVSTIDVARGWWELLLRARAVENLMYVVAANRVGEDSGGAEGVPYFGESLIVAPNGEILAQASGTEEEVVSAEIDLELLRQLRTRFHFFQDRRPDQYDIIADRSLVYETAKE